MKRSPLSEWIKRNKLSTNDFRELVRAQMNQEELSIYTVEAWRRGRSHPRDKAMAAIMVVTKNEITANDFIRLEHAD